MLIRRKLSWEGQEQALPAYCFVIHRGKFHAIDETHFLDKCPILNLAALSGNDLWIPRFVVSRRHEIVRVAVELVGVIGHTLENKNDLILTIPR